MSKVLLVRHAQSANNALPEDARVCDPGLTPLGYRQAESLAKLLSLHTIRGLFCSPFLRSLETAKPIAEAIGCGAFVRSDLFEQGGCYSGFEPGQEKGEPGMGFSELSQRYPGWHIDERIGQSGWWGRAYESWGQARERARAVRLWLQNHLVDQSDELDVLVIHADFKRLMLREMLGAAWSDQHDRQLGPLANTSISSMEFRQGEWILLSYNSVGHLHPGEQTH